MRKSSPLFHSFAYLNGLYLLCAGAQVFREAAAQPPRAPAGPTSQSKASEGSNSKAAAAAATQPPQATPCPKDQSKAREGPSFKAAAVQPRGGGREGQNTRQVNGCVAVFLFRLGGGCFTQNFERGKTGAWTQGRRRGRMGIELVPTRMGAWRKNGCTSMGAWAHEMHLRMEA